MYCSIVSSLTGVSGAGLTASPVIEDKVLLWLSYIMGEWSDMLSLARLTCRLGADKGEVRETSGTEGTELREDVMREVMSMVDLVDRPARRTDWRLGTDGAVTFSVFLAASAALATLLGANFVTLMLVGMTIFFFFAMLSWAGILRFLEDGVGLVVLSGTRIFWPSLLHVTRGAFEFAIHSGHHLLGACGDDPLLLSHVAGSR
jgi:hypothetical protein